MPTPEILAAMAAFALAASASPGPVNILSAMTGARFGVRRALPFVTGATVCFLAVFCLVGAGLLSGAAWTPALARPLSLIGAAYLLWLAWRLARADGAPAQGAVGSPPGLWSGVLVQGLNPKAWLAAMSAISAYVLPLPDPVAGLWVFSALFAVICWPSLALWAWGGAGLGRRSMRRFKRLMAGLLALSVAWMVADTLAA